MINKKKHPPHIQIMIDQLESYTNKQNKSKIKPHQNKTTTKNRWSSRFVPIVAPVVLLKRKFHHPTAVYVHAYVL